LKSPIPAGEVLSTKEPHAMKNPLLNRIQAKAIRRVLVKIIFTFYLWPFGTKALAAKKTIPILTCGTKNKGENALAID
jgi:hypothetical protein